MVINFPVTTSKIVAEHTGMSHNDVKELIRESEADFKEFGELYFVPDTQGGVYHLNEEQALLLVLCLDNTPKALEFKQEFVQKLFAVRNELLAQQED